MNNRSATVVMIEVTDMTPDQRHQLKNLWKEWRQYLSSLHLRRHSLMTQLNDYTTGTVLGTTPQEHARSDDINHQYFSDNAGCDLMSFGEQKTTDNILDHPEPMRPFGLKGNKTANLQMFQRLGAISGIRSRPVNDSIIASWTTASLPASDRNSTHASQFRNVYRDMPVQWSDASDEDDKLVDEPFTSIDNDGFSTNVIDGDTEMMASGTSVESVPLDTQRSSDKNWNSTEDDFPFMNDVTQALESPTPTPPPTAHACSPEFGIEQGDIIPFFPPLFSKFGPISRTSKYTSKYKDSVLRVTSDEMMKTAPVTAVTPLTQPPLMNAHPVPSRFTNIVDGGPGGEMVARQMPCPQYSLWKNQVNSLEQKAQQASTKDERLSVELLAVEMQISMKQQELKQCADLQRAQRQASEYMRRQQKRDNKIERGQDYSPKRL